MGGVIVPLRFSWRRQDRNRFMSFVAGFYRDLGLRLNLDRAPIGEPATDSNLDLAIPLDLSSVGWKLIVKGFGGVSEIPPRGGSTGAVTTPPSSGPLKGVRVV